MKIVFPILFSLFFISKVAKISKINIFTIL